MKIMTFNTQHCSNFLKKKIDFEAVAELIKKIDADIVGLNEIRGKGMDVGYQDQISILSELTGIENYYFAKAIDVSGQNPYGNAVLTKLAIKNVETIMIPDPADRTGTDHYETRCILKAKLENSLTVLITHMGLNPDEQKNAVATVVEKIEKEKCILMGDFNVSPDNDVLKPIREKMYDTAECFNTNLLSYPADNPEVKIDYIFVTPDIEVVDADIPEIVVSDHRPHIAEVKS